jgi:hypothetical protein
MKKLIIILLVLSPLYLLGQTNLNVSSSIKTQGNVSVYPGNGIGAGIGVEIDAKLQSKFKPFIGFNWDYFPGSEVLVDVEGETVPDTRSIPSLFIGIAYQPSNKFWVSLEGGPSFIPSQTYFSLKPTIGYYFDNNQRLGVDFSLTNIFNLDVANDGSYGYMSLGLMIKLF